MKIAVIGAGPAGLMFARLMKLARPDCDIVVFEQNPRAATYGFGVGISGGMRTLLKAYDKDVYARIQAASTFDNRQLILLNGASLLLQQSEVGGAIRRLDLLNILQAACESIGVPVEYGVRIDTREALQGFDLVAAADGANSSVRSLYAEAFGTTIDHLKNRHAWYGVGIPLAPSGLSFKHLDAGAVCAHYYAYTPQLSTFVAECDEQAWYASKLEGMTNDERRHFFEAQYSDELRGQPLIDNNSNWRCFAAVNNVSWTHDNIVLLGDALRSAHFSIGSGTRLAMEDSFALFDALVKDDFQVVPALSRFVQARRPKRDAFGFAAKMSFDWYENMGTHMQAPLMDFVHDFLTRTGRVDAERLRLYSPRFADDYATYNQTLS
jgi:2-polyprenyl-6-methoxyphenol hydroxylase-like FAD-dependent oxidoreductase